MKKRNLLFTLAFCLPSILLFGQAQPKNIEGKPTYQETVDYIEAHFKGELFTNGRLDAGKAVGDSWLSKNIKINSVKINDCSLHFEYEVETVMIGKYSTDPKINYYSKTFDLSKIEAISLSRSGSGWEDTYIYRLIFNEKNNPVSAEIDLPFGVSGSDFEAMKDAKIYKAFNHLRRLCGAPEPISFD